mmetsp:Transcript_2149/g.5321  ORF Transcript_2149/g.5321 Transcript_2149/m.5321 type:complete len:227 (-) Transcript_2149:1161-1841(-)
MLFNRCSIVAGSIGFPRTRPITSINLCWLSINHWSRAITFLAWSSDPAGTFACARNTWSSSPSRRSIVVQHPATVTLVVVGAFPAAAGTATSRWPFGVAGGRCCFANSLNVVCIAVAATSGVHFLQTATADAIILLPGPPPLTPFIGIRARTLLQPSHVAAMREPSAVSTSSFILQMWLPFLPFLPLLPFLSFLPLPFFGGFGELLRLFSLVTLASSRSFNPQRCA